MTRDPRSLSFLAVTVEGKVYACGEATNGRLGLGMASGTVPIPRQITALSSYVVKKVAVHSGISGVCAPRAARALNVPLRYQVGLAHSTSS